MACLGMRLLAPHHSFKVLLPHSVFPFIVLSFFFTLCFYGVLLFFFPLCLLLRVPFFFPHSSCKTGLFSFLFPLVQWLIFFLSSLSIAVGRFVSLSSLLYTVGGGGGGGRVMQSLGVCGCARHG